MPHRPQSEASARVTPVRGRDDAARLLRRAIDSGAPLITVVGPPGVGKTRLVQHVIAHAPVLDASRLGELTRFEELTDRTLIALIDHEGDSPCPVVFDGLDAADPPLEAIAAFVDRHKQLQLIVTRRSPLGVHGETIHRLTPLDLPTQTGQALHHQDRWPALQCFLDHARRADPTFEITPENARDTLMVLRSTGGLPLAIELTARWLHLIPVQELASRAVDLITSTPTVGDNLARTLDATFVHLSDRQLTTATAFAQFHGPVAVDVVAEVLGEEVDWADVSALANLGVLFPVERDGKAWFGMSPITARRLTATRPNPDQRRRYQLWLLDLIETNAPSLVTLDGARAMAALAPYVSGLPPLPTIFDDPDELANAALHLSAFWELAVQHHEGAHQLQASSRAITESPELLAGMMLVEARLRIFVDEYEAAAGLLLHCCAFGSASVREVGRFEEVLMYVVRHEPPPRQLLDRAAPPADSKPGQRTHPDLRRRHEELSSRVLIYRAARKSLLGDEAAATGLYERAVRWAQTNGHDLQCLGALQALAFSLANTGQLQRAQEVIDELEDYALNLGSPLDVMSAELLRSSLRSQVGDYEQAAAGIRSALDRAIPYLHPRFVYYWSLSLGLTLAEGGQIADAQPIFRRCIRAALTTDGDRLTPFVLASVVGAARPLGPPQPLATRLMAVARHLNPSALPPIAGPWESRAKAVGTAQPDLTATSALNLALDWMTSHGSEGGLGVLTRREHEVLKLVRRGMTDRDIADQLYVSVRTINTHVSTILRKLGVSSRSEAAALLEDDGS